MLISVLVLFKKEDLVFLYEHYKNEQTNKQAKLYLFWILTEKERASFIWFTTHNDLVTRLQLSSCHIINFIAHISS